MTQIINDKLKKCCEQCHSLLDKPCAWLSLGNEYCDSIMEVQQEIERLKREKDIVIKLNHFLSYEVKRILKDDDLSHIEKLQEISKVFEGADEN